MIGQALSAMVFGMMGIFIVMGLIIASINVLNRLTKPKDK